jgi:hypothetical protein
MHQSPDFLVSFPDHCAGLEVTEATTKPYQQFLTELERTSRLAGIFGEDGWVGDLEERSWCAAVLRAIRKKTRKIKDYGLSFPCGILI